ncbi:hypothetical protein RRG08_013030 [Elysia crispata]|uniref:Major facilitator superfamily (MFS) profile domain-containing protein n=1 Tax=Elysia crispata TaxID=231223 RepID=A0AAE1A014_9GAST|nr:hypothetical protein RRG08_013030 [Elysia crispata]
MLVGSLVLGILSDMFGRRKILLLSTVGHLIASLCVPWVRTFILYVILRFLVSFFGTGMILPAFVMDECLCVTFAEIKGAGIKIRRTSSRELSQAKIALHTYLKSLLR